MSLVEPDDSRKVDELCLTMVQELLKTRGKAPAELFHYTDSRGLVGILTDGAMWATNVAYVNDALEYQHGILEFLKILRDHKASAEKNLTATLIIKAIEDRITASNFVQPVWVTCFSPNGDDLSQWRSYGMGEGGYSIGFDADQLSQAAMLNDQGERSDMWPCVYDREVITRAIHDLLGKIVKLYVDVCVGDPYKGGTEDYRKEFVEQLIQRLHFIAPIVKHDSFRDEQEWRIIHHTAVGDVTDVKFRPKPTMLSAYASLKLTTKRTRRLPLTKIIVGPSRYKDISAEAVRALLLQLGYGETVPVIESVSPYRVA